MSNRSRREYIPKDIQKPKKSARGIVCVLFVIAALIAAALTLRDHIVYTSSGIRFDFQKHDEDEASASALSDSPAPLPEAQAAAFSPRTVGKISVEYGELPAYGPAPIDALYIDVSSMSLQTLAGLPAELVKKKVTSVVIDMKSEGGRLNYDSECALTGEINALDMSGGALEGFISDCTERGIRVAGRISCLCDDFTPERMPSLALKDSEGGLYRDADGHTWLDPDSQDAAGYLASVCAECAQLGLREIILDSLTLPPADGIAVDYEPLEKLAELCGLLSGAALDAADEKIRVSVFTYDDVWGEGANEKRGQDLTRLFGGFDRVIMRAGDEAEAQRFIGAAAKADLSQEKLAFVIADRYVSASLIAQ